ncbi:hypothetical protein P4V41_06405 [Fictibacillus nanhaiensis]|uniref:hypothetical protein n=1 Tax=Fictibacillus nanhaiensis TaxID=742169 RepID=UPI002E1CCCB2|nr:hypothetical protein [Fictibacillus nanhaiensis]
MSKYEFDNIKKHLNKEKYGKISFSDSGKDRVLMKITSSNKPKKKKMPLFQKLLLNAAAVVAFMVMGAIVVNEVQESPKTSVSEKNTETIEKKVVQEKPEQTVHASSGETTNDKEWTDRTVAENIENFDAKNLKEWIAVTDEMFKATLADVHADDPAHYYYLSASNVNGNLGFRYDAEGIAIEKDLKNLQALTGIVEEEHKKRYAHLNIENENPFKYKDQFKPADERLFQAHKYTADLISDINVAINKDGKGTNNGYAYMLDGDKIKELESFIKN